MSPLAAPTLPPEGGELDHYIERALAPETADLAPDAPVVAMTHGFMFDPFHSVDVSPKESDNPHRRLFHFERFDTDDRIRTRSVSWPADLGFTDSDEGAAGLVLAFGWHSKPGFAGSLVKGGKNFYARAYEYAEESAWVYASAIESLTRLLRERGRTAQLDLFTHSLGSRVVVRTLALALKHACVTDGELEQQASSSARYTSLIENRERLRELCRTIGRVVILGGSEYVVEGQLMYKRLLHAEEHLSLGLGEGPTIYNVVSRENDILDFLGENFGPRTFGNTNVLGHNGLGVKMERHRAEPGARWCDIPIDSADLRDWMSQRGLEVSGDRPDQIWDHWYYYTWPGNMELYRRILRDRDDWSIERLVAGEMPQKIDRGWLFGD